MVSKTPRELVLEMYELERMIVTSAFDPDRYIGWTPETLRANCEKQLELIHVQLKAGRRHGVMGKNAIHGLLYAARVALNFDIVNGLQVELQDAIVAFSEKVRENRRCDVALLYLEFVRSGAPVTDDLVDRLYRLLGSSFDDLSPGEEGIHAG
jgi:hypothetical protein